MEDIVLQQLFENVQYMRKVIPYLKPDYFDNQEDKIIIKCIKAYIGKYKQLPTYTVIKYGISKNKKLTEDTFTQCLDRITEIENYKKESYDLDWLVDETEIYVQDKAFENAIMQAVEIVQDKGGSKSEAHAVVTDALKISFDNHIGVELFADEDIDERWEKYHVTVAKYALDMCSLATSYVTNGYNTLYITLEMSQEKISQRIEANILNVEINNIPDMDEDTFKNTLKKIKTTSYGRFFCKEFPTGCAGANDFQRILDELKLKKKFVPQIIIVDYVNLMKSDRYSDANSYTVIKAITEELRGLAVSGYYAIITATQVNRGGADSSNVSMTDTAESYGLPATVDLLIAITSTEELRNNNIQVWKSLKNRLSGIVGWKWPLKTEYEFGRIVDLDDNENSLVEIKNSEKMEKLVNKTKKKKNLSQIKICETDFEDDLNDLMGE